jgi:hypothetical protein
MGDIYSKVGSDVGPMTDDRDRDSSVVGLRTTSSISKGWRARPT